MCIRDRRRGDGDGDGAGHHEAELKEVEECGRELLVDLSDVRGEAIQEPPQGIRVEEPERRPEQGRERAVVQRGRRGAGPREEGHRARHGRDDDARRARRVPGQRTAWGLQNESLDLREPARPSNTRERSDTERPLPSLLLVLALPRRNLEM